MVLEEALRGELPRRVRPRRRGGQLERPAETAGLVGAVDVTRDELQSGVAVGGAALVVDRHPARQLRPVVGAPEDQHVVGLPADSTRQVRDLDALGPVGLVPQDLLRHLFSLGRAAEHPERHAEDPVLVGGDELLETPGPRLPRAASGTRADPHPSLDRPGRPKFPGGLPPRPGRASNPGRQRRSGVEGRDALVSRRRGSNPGRPTRSRRARGGTPSSLGAAPGPGRTRRAPPRPRSWGDRARPRRPSGRRSPRRPSER